MGEEREPKSGNSQNIQEEDGADTGRAKDYLEHSSYPFLGSFTFLSPSWGAGGRLLGGSEGSEPGGPSPGTAFRGEGPPGRLGVPSAAPLSPPSGELRWLQGPDDT